MSLGRLRIQKFRFSLQRLAFSNLSTRLVMAYILTRAQPGLQNIMSSPRRALVTYPLKSVKAISMVFGTVLTHHCDRKLS